MKTKTVKVLPKTAGEIQGGGIYAQAVRCGKTNCKCRRGAPHTAFYFFTRRHGKLVKFYVRRADLEMFAALIAEANAEHRQQREAFKASFELLSGFRRELHSHSRQIKTLRGQPTDE